MTAFTIFWIIGVLLCIRVIFGVCADKNLIWTHDTWAVICAGFCVFPILNLVIGIAATFSILQQLEENRQHDQRKR